MRREQLHGLVDVALDLYENLLPRAPEEARLHFRSARREMLLGVKVLVEKGLERLEEEEGERSGTEEARAIRVE